MACDKGREMQAWAAGHVQLSAAGFWVPGPQEEPLFLFFRLREIENTWSALGPHVKLTCMYFTAHKEAKAHILLFF